MISQNPGARGPKARKPHAKPRGPKFKDLKESRIKMKASKDLQLCSSTRLQQHEGYNVFKAGPAYAEVEVGCGTVEHWNGKFPTMGGGGL